MTVIGRVAPPVATDVTYLLDEARSLHDSRPHEAVALCTEALARAREGDDGHLVAACLVDLAIAQWKNNDFGDSLINAHDARALYERLNAPLGVANAIQNIGIVHLYLGGYQLSLHLFTQSLALYREAGDEEGMANLYADLGLVHSLLGNHEEGVEVLKQGLALHERRQWTQGIARTLNDLGYVLNQWGKPEDAIPHLQRAIALWTATNQTRGLGFSLKNLGHARLAQGESAEARHLFRQSYDLRAGVDDQRGMAESLHGMALADLAEGQPLAAIHTLRDSLVLLDTIQARPIWYRCHLALSQAFETVQDYEQALFHFEIYDRLKDELFNESTQQTAEVLKVTFKVAQQQREAAFYREQHEMLTRALAEQVTLLETVQEQSRVLGEIMREDALTGLYNRRAFDERLAHEWERSRRFGHSFTIALLDVDHFKRVNDSYGHDSGDMALKDIATIFASNCRATDTVARYGGEEFGMIFPETTLEQGLDIIKDMCRLVRHHTFTPALPTLRITLSAGIASNQEADTVQSLLMAADRRLYQAKNAGRNRVVMAP